MTEEEEYEVGYAEETKHVNININDNSGDLVLVLIILLLMNGNGGTATVSANPNQATSEKSTLINALQELISLQKQKHAAIIDSLGSVNQQS